MPAQMSLAQISHTNNLLVLATTPASHPFSFKARQTTQSQVQKEKVAALIFFFFSHFCARDVVGSVADPGGCQAAYRQTRACFTLCCLARTGSAFRRRERSARNGPPNTHTYHPARHHRHPLTTITATSPLPSPSTSLFFSLSFSWPTSLRTHHSTHADNPAGHERCTVLRSHQSR